MNLVTITQLASHIGISKQAVHKAMKTGKIFYKDTENKLIDMDDKDIQKYINSRNKKNSEVQKNISKEKAAVEIKEKVQIQEQIQKQYEADPTSFDAGTSRVTEDARIRMPVLKFMDKTDLEKQKIIEDILKLQINNDKKRAELIDRDFVKGMFLKLYNIDVNEFLQLGASLSAKISTIFEIDDPEKLALINKSINKELYRTQEHIKKELDKFLDEMAREGVA